MNRSTGIPIFDPRHPPPKAKPVISTATEALEGIEGDDTGDTLSLAAGGGAATAATKAAPSAVASGDRDRAQWSSSGAVTLSDELKGLVREFATHFEKEMKELGDLALRKELEVLYKFIAPSSSSAAPSASRMPRMLDANRVAASIPNGSVA